MDAASITIRLMDAFMLSTPARIIHEAESGVLPIGKGEAPPFLLEAPFTHLRLMFENLKLFHRQTSPSYLVMHGLIDLVTTIGSGLCIGNVKNGARATKVSCDAVSIQLIGNRVAVLSMDDPEFTKKVQHIWANPTPTANAIATMVGYLVGGPVSLPLQVARTQLRHDAWRGWRNAIPSAKSGLSKSLYLSNITNYVLIGANDVLRNWTYDLLGRPFVHPYFALTRQDKEVDTLLVAAGEDEDTWSEEEERRREGGEPIIGGRREGEKQEEKEREEKEKEEESEDPRGWKELLCFHTTVRAIALGSTALVGVLHLPIINVMHRLMLSPGEGFSHCVNTIWEAEGWKGFYRGAGWYLLVYSDVLWRPITIEN